MKQRNGPPTPSRPPPPLRAHPPTCRIPAVGRRLPDAPYAAQQREGLVPLVRSQVGGAAEPASPGGRDDARQEAGGGTLCAGEGAWQGKPQQGKLTFSQPFSRAKACCAVPTRRAVSPPPQAIIFMYESASQSHYTQVDGLGIPGVCGHRLAFRGSSSHPRALPPSHPPTLSPHQVLKRRPASKARTVARAHIDERQTEGETALPPA